ncbi:MAG: cytochrome C554 [bacterium]|nr:cytochrome C554 [bacterium]
MKRMLIFTISLLFVFSLAYSADFTYVGVKKCKLCHKGVKKGEVYEKWMSAKHSKAFETLKKKNDGSDKNPKCLECHTTGYDKGGYKIGDANAAKFEGVQCESCHGAGSAYKKMKVMKSRDESVKNGMLIPNEESCKKCHNKKSPTFKGFDFKEAMKKIDHRFEKKKK